MSRKFPVFRHCIPRLVKPAPRRAYRRLLGLLLLAVLALVTTLCVPAISAQQVKPETDFSQLSVQEVNSQTSNAYSLLQQGVQLYEAQQFSEATQVWQRGLEAFVSQGDSLNQALVWRYLSLAYQHLGQWEEAEAAIGNAIALLEAQSPNLQDNQQHTTNTQHYLDIFAKTLNTQGRLQWAKGQLEEAILTWKKAAATYAKAGNQTGVIGSLINQAEALQLLGLSSQAKAELENVEQILLQQSDPELQATGLQNLGKALRRVGNLRTSQAVLQKSLQVAQDFELPRAIASALLELGNTERALGERAIAIGKEDDKKKHTQAAIEYYQQAANLPTFQLQAQLNLLSLLVQTGKWIEVATLGSTIQPAIANLPPSRTNIYAQLNFARSLTELGRRDWEGQTVGIAPTGTRGEKGTGKGEQEISPLQGLGNREGTSSAFSGQTEPSSTTLQPRRPTPSSVAQIVATAVQQAYSLNDRTAESYAVGQLGGLYELTQQWTEAQNLTQQALLLAEEIQAPNIRYRWEWQLGRLGEKQGDIKKAIAAYEEAVKTIKLVRSDLLTIDADIQFSFRDNVEPIHRKLVDLLLRPPQTPPYQGGAGGVSPSQAVAGGVPSQENLKRAIEVIDSLQLAELENFLSCNLSQKVQLSVDIDKVDPKAAFIYPIILEDRLAVITKLPGQSLKYYVTPVQRTEVEKTAIALQTSILKRNVPEVVIEKATQLYEWLIEPLEADLENSRQVNTLVFVLDGVLRNIPMSVLYDAKRQEYLMQKPYALALVPGLQLFDLRPLQRERLKVLTAGISEKRQVEGQSFETLPNVVEEVHKIKSFVPSQSLLNPEFTQANLQQQLNSGAFSAVHIATHGNFSSDPEETYILAYNELLNSNELNDILRINNQSPSSIIELLVLSACETAQGDNRATLGLAGIAVRAGARSTLATLWKVSDRSTVALMEQFYTELTNPELTKAQALHQAQLAVFERYKAPYYWAPYILVGNWL